MSPHPTEQPTAPEGSTAPDGAVRGRSRGRALLRTPVVAAVVLLAAYGVLSLAMDPRGSLGTDTGGKVATLEVMDGGIDPDVGWWAADEDPDADLHGLWFTSRLDDRYVNVTTLPLVLVASPLYDVGGYRLALLVPMAGAVAAAFAGRALARRVGAEEDVAWWAYWVVGLASPVAVYALDLWEHTWGVALMGWGIVAALDAVEDGGRLVPAGLAGLAFGASFSLRTESLVYGFVALAVACTTLLVARRRAARAVGVGLAALGGVVAGLVANAALETAVLGTTFRAGRASGAVSGGGSDLGSRLEEAIATSANLEPNPSRQALVTGLLLAAGLAALAWGAGRPRSPLADGLAVAVVVAGYALRVGDGPGFVPGLVAATPLAAAGVVAGWRLPRARLPLAMALLALPPVWWFQYRGGALPQWGGRYVLATGLVLGVVGVVASARFEPWRRRTFVACAVLVTAFGLLWLSERSHEVGRAAADVAARPEPVLISREAFWLRELGAAYPGTRWMSAPGDDDLDRAVAIAADQVDEVGVLEIADDDDPPAAIGPLRATGTDEYRWLGVPFRITTYERDG